MLLVNEIFDNFQGEGYFTGTPCTFVRLQGCSVGCRYCDTKNTWTTSSKYTESVQVVLAKDSSSQMFFCKMIAQDVVKHVNYDHVVITGGEPFEQDIDQLIIGLLNNRKFVQIETSGAFNITAIKNDRLWITVSPKFTAKTNHDQVLKNCSLAQELKVVVDSTSLPYISDIVDIAERVNAKLLFQPEFGNKMSYDVCKDLSVKHDARLSIQTHKLLTER